MRRLISRSRAARDVRRASRAAVFAALAGTLAAVLAFTVAPSSGASPATVLVGGVPAPASGARDSGPLQPSRQLSLTLILRPRDAAALESFATAVSTPGSPLYHHYLSVQGFARRFGSSSGSVALVRRTLAREGLHVGAVAKNALSLRVSGSVRHISHAFGVRLHGYREASGRQVYANVSPPRVPAALGKVVQGVLGLDDLTAAAPAGIAPAPRRVGAHAPHARTAAAVAGPKACAAATSTASTYHAFTIDQIDHGYGIDGLYSQGDNGAGVTVALIEAESYSTIGGDIGAFYQCFFGNATPNVQTEPVDGGASGGDGEETSVDIQNTLGVAPAASIIVYQGPDSEQGIYATFSQTITDRKAQVIQDAWADCESLRNSQPGSLISGENNLLQEAAAQGQTFLSSSGDRGSEGCQTINNPNEIWGASTTATELAVMDPAAQPFATSVGGTELTATGPAPTETVWNQFGWGSGGGGISNIWPMPAYQSSYGAPGAINSYTSGAPCGAPSGQYCREVPDVSASASTRDGYVIYYDGGWTAVGGTSTSTPVWAGLIALADASTSFGCSSSSPLGFINPDLYEIANGAGGHDAFNDVTSGDNNPSASGAYPATSGYDMATGLGTPIATDGSQPGLVAQLCEAHAGGIPTQAPTITAVTHESAAGGNVTITGTGFTPFARVMFGSTAAASVTYVSSTQLQAVVPAGSGVLGVSVATVAGTAGSTQSAANKFTYAPTATISSPAAGAGYTQGQVLAASFSCSASTSGTPGCTGSQANGSPIDTSSAGTHQFSVTATDANNFATTTTATYTVVAAPAIAVATPANGASYLQGQSAAASFRCSSTAPVTIVGCSGPIAPGSAIDTSSLGSHSFKVTATDSNGVSSSTTVTYAVVSSPTTTITVPANGAIFVAGASVSPVFGCSAPAPAQIASCTATTVAGHLDTAAVGTHHFAVTATENGGAGTTTTVTYEVVGVQAKLSGVRQASARWLARGSRHGRLAVGTTFSFSLDQPAKVTLRFSRQVGGRVKGGRCLAASAVHGKARACVRKIAAGTVLVTGADGANAVNFSGKTSAGDLIAGSYTVTLTAVGLSGKPSAPATLHFTVSTSK